MKFIRITFFVVFLIFVTNLFSEQVDYIDEGLKYSEGDPSIRDFNKAKEYFELAIKEGEPLGYNEIGNLYFSGGNKFEKDIEKAYEYYVEGAKYDVWNCHHNLGLLYSYHLSEDKLDTDKAILHFTKSSEAGYGPSSQELGYIYADKNNKEQSLEYLEKSVSQNEGDMSIYTLYNTRIFFLGMQNPKDIKSTIDGLTKGLNFKGGRCEYLLSLIYFTKEFGNQNLDLAMKYLDLSCDERFSPALVKKGKYLLFGIGYGINREEAKLYLQDAFAMGENKVGNLLGSIALEDDFNTYEATEFFKIGLDAGSLDQLWVYSRLVIMTKDDIYLGLMSLLSTVKPFHESNQIALFYHILTEDEKKQITQWVKQNFDYTFLSQFHEYTEYRNIRFNKKDVLINVTRFLSKRLTDFYYKYFEKQALDAYELEDFSLAKDLFEFSYRVGFQYNYIKLSGTYFDPLDIYFSEYQETMQEHLMNMYVSDLTITEDIWDCVLDYTENRSVNMGLLSNVGDNAIRVWKTDPLFEHYQSYIEGLNKFMTCLNDKYNMEAGEFLLGLIESNNVMIAAFHALAEGTGYYEKSGSIELAFNHEEQELYVIQNLNLINQTLETILYGNLLKMYHQPSYIKLIDSRLEYDPNSIYLNSLKLIGEVYGADDVDIEHYAKIILPKVHQTNVYGQKQLVVHLAAALIHMFSNDPQLAQGSILNAFEGNNKGSNKGFHTNSFFLQYLYKIAHIVATQNKYYDEARVYASLNVFNKVNLYNTVFNNSDENAKRNLLVNSDAHFMDNIALGATRATIYEVLVFKNLLLYDAINTKAVGLKNQKTFFKRILNKYFVDPQSNYLLNNLKGYRDDLLNLEKMSIAYLRSELSYKQNPFTDVSVNAFIEKLEEDEVLIEYFTTGNGTKIAQADSNSIYAFGISNTGYTQVYHICKIDEFDKKLRRLDFFLENQISGDKLNVLMTDISETLLSPFKDSLGGIQTLHIAPHGDLYKVNFSTLLFGKNTYLSEKFVVNTINSGKDLMFRKPYKAPLKKEISLFANPTFDTDSNENAKPLLVSKEYSSGFRDGLMRSAISTLEQLPGTQKEIDLLYDTLKGQSVILKKYDGEAATKENLSQQSSPYILHIATHGLFINDYDDVPIDERSFLALTGASNTYKKMMDGKDDHNFDGIFTCKEASVLDLNKTLLVNLSACNTGLGSTMTIEGIGGFRRAFSLSGAKNLMITLKPISDEFTAKYMNLFYTKLSNNNWNVLKAYQETNNFFINYFRTEGEVLDIYEYIAPFVLSSWEK